jgi:hypothetical protein
MERGSNGQVPVQKCAAFEAKSVRRVGNFRLPELSAAEYQDDLVGMRGLVHGLSPFVRMGTLSAQLAGHRDPAGRGRRVPSTSCVRTACMTLPAWAAR